MQNVYVLFILLHPIPLMSSHYIKICVINISDKKKIMFIKFVFNLKANNSLKINASLHHVNNYVSTKFLYWVTWENSFAFNKIVHLQKTSMATLVNHLFKNCWIYFLFSFKNGVQRSHPGHLFSHSCPSVCVFVRYQTFSCLQCYIQ